MNFSFFPSLVISLGIAYAIFKEMLRQDKKLHDQVVALEARVARLEAHFDAR